AVVGRGRPAELLRRGQPDDPLPPGDQPGLPVDEPLLVPPVEVGEHLPFDERGHDLAERLVVGLVEVLLHCPVLLLVALLLVLRCAPPSRLTSGRRRGDRSMSASAASRMAGTMSPTRAPSCSGAWPASSRAWICSRMTASLNWANTRYQSTSSTARPMRET